MQKNEQNKRIDVSLVQTANYNIKNAFGRTNLKENWTPLKCYSNLQAINAHMIVILREKQNKTQFYILHLLCF